MTISNDRPKDPSSYVFEKPSDEQVKAAFDALREASKNAAGIDEKVLDSLDEDFKIFMRFLADNAEKCQSPEECLEYVNKAENAYYNQTKLKQDIHEDSHKTQRGVVVTVAKYVFAAATLVAASSAAAYVAIKK